MESVYTSRKEMTTEKRKVRNLEFCYFNYRQMEGVVLQYGTTGLPFIANKVRWNVASTCDYAMAMSVLVPDLKMIKMCA